MMPATVENTMDVETRAKLIARERELIAGIDVLQDELKQVRAQLRPPKSKVKPASGACWNDTIRNLIDQQSEGK